MLARFVPLMATFTPFVAGVARMGYRRFAIYNLVGGVGWVVTMSLAGYWLGQIRFVSEHFEEVVFLIVLVSLLPIAISFLRAWRRTKNATTCHDARGLRGRECIDSECGIAVIGAGHRSGIFLRPGR